MKQFKIYLNVFTFISYPHKWVGQRNEIIIKKQIVERKVFERVFFFSICMKGGVTYLVLILIILECK